MPSCTESSRGCCGKIFGKSPVGAVKLEFQELAEAYKFTEIEDDHPGLSPERVKEAAVHKGILTPESAAAMDMRRPSRCFSRQDARWSSA